MLGGTNILESRKKKKKKSRRSVLSKADHIPDIFSDCMDD